MRQASKWDGLLDIDEPDTPAPSRSYRHAAAVSALIVAACLLASISWWIWTQTVPATTAQTQESAPTMPAPVSTTAQTQESAPATSTIPTPTPTADVFAPARETARTWIERFYVERTEATTWTQITQRLAPYQTWAMGVYLAERPEVQAAPLNVHRVEVAYSDETADVEHPTAWSATATITLDDGEHVQARITVIPDPDTVEGGWKVDEWKVLR